MATGTPTLSDSYWLGQSAILSQRVQVAFTIYCGVVTNEGTGVTGHAQRKAQVITMLAPANFTQWVQIFTMFVAYDANLIAAATQSSTNYTPITTPQAGDLAAADGQSPNVTSILISNAIAASFNNVVGGI